MSRQPTTKKTLSPTDLPAAANARPASGNGAIREVKPSAEEVRKRAYELYLARKAVGRGGSPESDWVQAERELIAKGKR